MKKGTKQIFSHSFFKKLKWNDVYTRGSAGPFKPPMSADPFDMSNFDEYEDEVIEGVQSDLTEREQKMFSNF